jgi:hypothetical protein
MRQACLLGRSATAAAVIVSLGLAPRAVAQEARGVNPADNLTKVELLPKLTVIDDGGGISTTTLTLKYDRAIRGVYGFNVELPLVRFEAPVDSTNGIGDLNLRARAQKSVGSFVVIGGLEAVVPIATDPTLGSGKLQINPVAAGVYAFSRSVFAAAAAKHLFSVAGDDDRADVKQGQYRLLLAYSSPRGWWALLDPQIWVDFEVDRRSELALELEAGKMIGPKVGAWVRAGGHVGGSWPRQDWTVSGGIRFISL